VALLTENAEGDPETEPLDGEDTGDEG
jgi:hypothetical protein